MVVIDDVQEDRFKLYYFYETDSWELFCLSEDRGETENIVASQPAVARQLAAKMNEWLTQQHPTWQPKYPLRKPSLQPAGPPPTLAITKSSEVP